MFSTIQEGVKEAGLTWPPGPWQNIAPTLSERLRHQPFLMAPMAGVTDAAYRMIARAGGAALAYSEMVSVTGIHYQSKKTWELVEPHDEESELAVQLFGSDVDHFAEAVPLIVERLKSRLALIDVNMACPVPKVTKSGAGSALLDNPDVSAAIISTIRTKLNECGCSHIPVTAKLRIGRTPDTVVGPEFAKHMEEAGADAVAVHGRFASQMYRGKSNIGEVKRVVEAVSIPVIATGDALDAHRSVSLLTQTGSAGCFIARGSYGNPWIFNTSKELMNHQSVASPSLHMKLSAFRLHVRLLEATGAHIARARSLAGWYLRGMPEAAAWRERAMHCSGINDYIALADELEMTCG